MTNRNQSKFFESWMCTRFVHLAGTGNLLNSVAKLHVDASRKKDNNGFMVLAVATLKIQSIYVWLANY